MTAPGIAVKTVGGDSWIRRRDQARAPRTSATPTTTNQPGTDQRSGQEEGGRQAVAAADGDRRRGQDAGGGRHDANDLTRRPGPYPAVLTESGLAGGVRALAERSPVPVTVAACSTCSATIPTASATCSRIGSPTSTSSPRRSAGSPRADR